MGTATAGTVTVGTTTRGHVPDGRAGQAIVGQATVDQAPVGRTHVPPGARTVRQDPGSRAEDPAAVCYSCCIFAIPVAIPSPNVRNSRNSSSYSSYSQYVRVQE